MRDNLWKSVLWNVALIIGNENVIFDAFMQMMKSYLKALIVITLWLNAKFTYKAIIFVLFVRRIENIF